jgi:hypothetical protein
VACQVQREDVAETGEEADEEEEDVLRSKESRRDWRE